MKPVKAKKKPSKKSKRSFRSVRSLAQEETTSVKESYDGEDQSEDKHLL